MSLSTTVHASPLNASASRGATIPVALLGLIALLPALFSVTRVNILETMTAAGLFGLAALFLLIRRRLSPTAAGIALMLLFVATLMNLSPLSLRGTLQQGWTGSPSERWIALGVPLGCTLLMALMSFQSPVKDRAGVFISSLSVRFNLWLIACLAVAGGLLLGGYQLQNIAPLALLLVAAIFALRPLLVLGERPGGVLIVSLALTLVLLANLVGGAAAYAELRTALEKGRAAAAAKNDAEAQNQLNQALRLNERVQSRSLLIDTQRELGLLDEQNNRFESAVYHWQQVAAMTGVEFGNHPAARRIMVRQGDSLLGWRQLVEQGFKSVMNDELIPGLMALGDRPDADVRGTLLPALVRWERGDAESERRASLEKVLTKRANDVSANTLLNVLGRPLPKDALWLGSDLIVGDHPSESSASGAIQDLGTVDSVVFLTEGNWECRVKAHGTPMNEEWPILRVELDGVEALRARVNKAEPTELPFTFDVKTRNLYRIRFVFENPLNIFQGNQQAFRGLVIEGVSFQRAGP